MRYVKQFPWGCSSLEADFPPSFHPFHFVYTSRKGGEEGGSVMGHNKLSLTEETRVNLDDTQVYRYCRRRLIGFSCNEINLCSVSKIEPVRSKPFSLLKEDHSSFKKCTAKDPPLSLSRQSTRIVGTCN